MPFTRTAALLLLGLSACANERAQQTQPPDAGLTCEVDFDPSLRRVSSPSAVRIQEVVSANDGVHLDELGETDDFVELENTGDTSIQLGTYWLTDAQNNQQRLPALELEAGGVVLLWADGQPAEGSHHLAMKLSAEGERLTLWQDPCTAVDQVVVPALAVNESYARLGDGSFRRCRYATPGRENGACAPGTRPELPEHVSFAPFAWPDSWPDAPAPLALNELSLRPAGFIEVVNTSSSPVTLSAYRLLLGAVAANDSAPMAPMRELAWPQATLAAGARVVVPVTSEDTAAVAASEDFEGEVSLRGAEGPIDRASFIAWPDQHSLARVPDASGPLRFCAETSPGQRNTCTALAERPLGERAHALRTDGDFARLAAGGTALGLTAVKFVIDMRAEDRVHLLDARRWALHYQFVRERIYGEPALDRCDPVQARQFDEGWRDFSRREYGRIEGRRFLLGTLVHHANGMHTVEFAAGDAIDAPLMKRAFLAIVLSTLTPRLWSLRPADAAQVAALRELEGSLPVVAPNAPFADIRYQPLTRALSFGLLRFVPATELEQTALGPRTIVITDDVPNDIPFVGGLITEAFQTPLSHVNVLSEARGSPNMALRDARHDPRLQPLLNKLVRLDVGARDFEVREASRDEVEAFWSTRLPTGPRVVPPGDTGVRHVVALAGQRLADLPALGAKAAQFAELYRIDGSRSRCGHSGGFRVPPDAFAIPVAHYAEHFEASGARAQLEALQADRRFHDDANARDEGLRALRETMLRHPVEPALLVEVEAAVRARFGERRVRFRSSSNVEDLPSFNGAGLHTSVSAELDDPTRSVEDALRTVWSSLWDTRAYDEREHANIDQSAVLMGLLVHAAHRGEAAQGVGISRDLLDLTRDDIYYLNAQLGEATVTNPAPGVTTEELLYSWTLPELSYRSQSSLASGGTVLTLVRARRVACALAAVHEHFRPLLDPTFENRVFAMQIEFKFERDDTLVVKQARPQPFASSELPADCR